MSAELDRLLERTPCSFCGSKPLAPNEQARIDHLEALANQVNNGYGSAFPAYADAANPAAVLELIALARRATQPVAAPTAGDALKVALDALDRSEPMYSRQFSQQERKAQHISAMDSVRAALANQPAPTVPAIDFDEWFNVHSVGVQLRSDKSLKELRGLFAHQPAQEQAEPRYTSDGALAECPCCGSLDVGGAHDTVHCYGCGLTVTGHRPLQNAIDIWNRRTGRPAPAKAPQALVGAAPDAQPLAHGHRDDFYLLANARRLGLEPMSRMRNMPNWVLAMELFATGSTSAYQICRDAGVNPDSCEAGRAPTKVAPQGEMA